MKLRWILVLVLFMVYFPKWRPYYAVGDPNVPCYYIFGDSLADSGNNNKLQTLAKVDYSPYGIDFPKGPSGRFCNGRTVVDIIAKNILGSEYYIPPLATMDEADLPYGANYASGAAGIRDETGQELGERISMNMQLRNHEKIVLKLIDILGNESASRHLSKCLYSVGMGTNDYLNNYFLNQYFPTSHEYTLDQYAQLLVEEYSQQLLTLYSLGARRVVVFGLGKIGCTPGAIDTHGTNGSACVDLINNASRLFNSKLVPLIDQLNDGFPDAKFIYINSYKIEEDSTILDFKVNNTACCPSSAIGQCIPGQIPCQNRTQFMFWDSFNPTEIFNIFYAEKSYSASQPSYAYPYDIRHLISFDQPKLGVAVAK